MHKKYPNPWQQNAFTNISKLTFIEYHKYFRLWWVSPRAFGVFNVADNNDDTLIKENNYVLITTFRLLYIQNNVQGKRNNRLKVSTIFKNNRDFNIPTISRGFLLELKINTNCKRLSIEFSTHRKMVCFFSFDVLFGLWFSIDIALFYLY